MNDSNEARNPERLRRDVRFETVRCFDFECLASKPLNRQPHRAQDGAPICYECHRREQTRLHCLVQPHASTFSAKAEAGVDLQIFP